MIPRLAWLLLVLALTAAMSLLVWHNLSIRFISDTRFELNKAALDSLYRSIPNSPRLNLRLALLHLSEVTANESALNDAEFHARAAVNHWLWDYRAQQVLGTILEMRGDEAGAEQALRKSVNLSPNYTRANWALGNLLLRQGRVGESIAMLRRAALSSDDLYLQIYEMLWQVSGGNIGPLRELAVDNTTAQLILVRYLFDRSLPDQAFELFRSIDRSARLRSSKTDWLISQLVAAGAISAARQLWADMMTEQGAATVAGIWNGNFELETYLDTVDTLDRPKIAEYFDWRFAPSIYARIGIDAISAGNGQRSLRLSFVGHDTTTLRDEVRQPIYLRPGGRYQLEFSYRTRDLQTPEGPRVAIMSGAETVASSLPVPTGSVDGWQRASFQFVAPADDRPKHLAIIRIPKFSYDDPTRGSVWFDDLTLRELPPETGMIER